MALSRYLCNGCGTHDSSYLFAHWPSINRATLLKDTGMPSGAGGYDLQPEPSLGACIANGDALDGDDWGISAIKSLVILCV